MINAKFYVPQSLKGFLGSLGSAGRHLLFSAAASKVCDLVRRHIASEAGRRHFSASRLGAAPTGHLEKAARKTVFHADATRGEVVIPAPGFGRAFHDVEISPTSANALTIPTDKVSYGRRVSEVRALGWTIYRPKGKDFLLGSKAGSKGTDEVVCLYVLKKRVQQRQDRSLLPSDAEIGATATRAMMAEIQRVGRKAGMAA